MKGLGGNGGFGHICVIGTNGIEVLIVEGSGRMSGGSMHTGYNVIGRTMATGVFLL